MADLIRPTPPAAPHMATLPHPLGERHYLYAFPNDWGASVVERPPEWPGADRWFVALLDPGGELLDEPPIPEAGPMAWPQVVERLHQIAALPRCRIVPAVRRLHPQNEVAA